MWEGCDAADTPGLDLEAVRAAAKAIAGTQFPSGGCARGAPLSVFFENRGLAASLMHLAGLLPVAHLQACAASLPNTCSAVLVGALLRAVPRGDVSCCWCCLVVCGGCG